jgi:hypothetical protein
MGEVRNTCKIFVRKPQGRDHLDDSIRMDLTKKKGGWDGVDWMHLVQGSNQWCVLVNAIMNLWV